MIVTIGDLVRTIVDFGSRSCALANANLAANLYPANELGLEPWTSRHALPRSFRCAPHQVVEGLRSVDFPARIPMRVPQRIEGSTRLDNIDYNSGRLDVRMTFHKIFGTMDIESHKSLQTQQVDGLNLLLL